MVSPHHGHKFQADDHNSEYRNTYLSKPRKNQCSCVCSRLLHHTKIALLLQKDNMLQKRVQQLDCSKNKLIPRASPLRKQISEYMEHVMGATQHTDPIFLTLLSQDNVGGLQVFHQNQWIDVQPLRGALIVNLRDLMQLLTNDTFKSVQHRVLLRKKEARTSIACFFYPSRTNMSKPYNPIQELQILQNKTTVYKKTFLAGYMKYYTTKGVDGTSPLPHFRARQLLTNDTFKSVQHMVLLRKKEARTSIACFFYPSRTNMSKPYNIIQELQILQNKTTVYKTFLAGYMKYCTTKGIDGTSPLPHFRAR